MPPPKPPTLSTSSTGATAPSFFLLWLPPEWEASGSTLPLHPCPSSTPKSKRPLLSFPEVYTHPFAHSSLRHQAEQTTPHGIKLMCQELCPQAVHVTEACTGTLERPQSFLGQCQTLAQSQRAQLIGAMVRSGGDGSDRLETQGWKDKRQEPLVGTVGQMVRGVNTGFERPH